MSWVDDSQGFVKPGSSPVEFVIEGKATSGTPVNARFSTALTQEAGYFEISAVSVKDSCFIGVTSANSFKKGWGCKGLLFGRNLSSGSALVHGDFGPKVETGSTVGVLTEFQGEGADRKIAVTFWHDGKCLGPAFLSKLADPTTEVFPMVQCSKDGDRFAIAFPAAPAMDAPAEAAADPREGEWMLQSLKVGPELGEFPLQERLGGGGGRGKGRGKGGGEVILKVQKVADPDVFQFSWRIVNQSSMTAVSTPDGALAPFEKLAPSTVQSTRMMGEPGPMEAEQQVSVGMTALTKWIVDQGVMLLNGPTVEMELTSAGAGGGGGGELPATSVDLA